MKKLLPLAIILALLPFNSSCDPKDRDETSIFYIGETQCSDPWGNAFQFDNEQLKEAVRIYLTNEGIEVKEITIETDSSIMYTCAACTCGTSRTIKAEVDEASKAKIESLGFQQ